MSWNCQYCTLINAQTSVICLGCGSQNPHAHKLPSNGPSKLIPKFLRKTADELKNIANDLLGNTGSTSSHHIVRIQDLNPQNIIPISHSMPNNQLNGYDPGVSDLELPSSDLNDQNFHNSSMCSVITSNVKKEVQDESDAIYQRIINYCMKSNDSFIDDSFPHSDRSIGVLRFKRNNIQVVETPNFLKWLRPSQMFTKDGRQFRWSVMNNPVPSDIEQGTLVGNCWLMSAMALIAERPDILDEIFPKKEYSHFGVYQVKVCVEGEWRVIIVDDFFPCYSNNHRMAMAVGRKNQLWVPLIEKALAKAVGSYSKLHGASLTQGLSMLTGGSCINYQTPDTRDDIELFWANLISSKESGFLMCCVCGKKSIDNPADDYYRSMGLLSNHAYSILDVVCENGIRLLRIRNPWGSFVWNGKWSDNWPHWNEDMKNRLLRNRRGETGAFWIELDDFVPLFTYVTICKLRPNWSELRLTQIIKKRTGHPTQMLQIIVTDRCEASFMAFQKGTFKSDDDNVNDIMISVHRLSPDQRIGELMGRSLRLTDRHVTTDEFFLSTGHYVVICHNLKMSPHDFTVNIVVHSSIQLFGEFIALHPLMITESLHQIVDKEGTIVRDENQGMVIRTLSNKFRGMIITAQNQMENRWLHISVDCSDSMNIQSSRGSLIVTDVIPPLCRQIIVILSTIDDIAEYRIANNLKSLVCKKQYIGQEMNYEAYITNPKLQNYPQICSKNDYHWPSSVFLVH